MSLASPLDEADLAYYVEEHQVEDLFILDGEIFHVEDLHFCSGCMCAFTDEYELSRELSPGDPLCSDCESEAIDAARDEEEKWSDWRRWQ